MSKPVVELEVALACLHSSQQKMLDMILPKGEAAGMPPVLATVDVALWSINHNMMLSQLVAAFTAELAILKRTMKEGK